MDATLQPLLDRAFGVAPAVDANRAISEARESQPGEKPASYEVVVKEGQSLPALAAALLPKLVYHLESIGAHPPGCGDVFLSLFVGERLHFVRASEALPLLLEAAQLTAEQAVARFGTGELRRVFRPGEDAVESSPKPPLLLGAGPQGE